MAVFLCAVRLVHKTHTHKKNVLFLTLMFWSISGFLKIIICDYNMELYKHVHESLVKVHGFILGGLECK